MNIGEKVWLSNRNKVAEIIDIKTEWTSFPHGSGSTIYFYTLKVGEQIIINDTSCDDFDEMFSIEQLKHKNSCLEIDIKDIKLKIAK